jgi:putative redox protein
MPSVTVKSEQGFQVSVESRGHRATFDESGENGGEDAGLSPKEVLLAAIASCAAMTMAMYAKRKGWPLEGSEVYATLETAEAGKPAKIVQTIALKGPLDAEQRERLREIAGKCPVHKIVQGPTVLEERLA